MAAERVTLAAILADRDRITDWFGELPDGDAQTLWCTAIHVLEHVDEAAELRQRELSAASELRSEGHERPARVAEWAADLYADRAAAEEYMVAYAAHAIDQFRGDLEAMRVDRAPVAVRALEAALLSAYECLVHLVMEP